MHAEIERQDFGEFETFLFQRSLDDEQFPPGREGFVSCRPIDRALGDTISALGTGEDIVRDLFKPLWNDGYTKTKFFLRDKGKELKQKPLS